MRARMALHVSGLDYEHREIALRDKPAEMLAASSKGTVPVFIREDGQVIEESLDLMAYALTQNDPENWQQDGAQDFIAIIDDPFKHHLDRYKYASRYDETLPRGAVDLGHRAQAIAALAPFEAALSQHQNLLGKAVSLADIATFPFIRQFAAVEREWWNGGPLPKTRDWLARHLASDLFKAVMAKHPLWESPAANLP